MFKNKAVCASLCLISLLSGCVRPSRQIRVPKIASLTEETADYSSTHNNVSLYVRKLSKKDSKHLFDGTSLPKDIVGLQVTIENQTDISYVIKEKSFGMALLDYHDVALTMKKSGFWNFMIGLFSYNAYANAVIVPLVAVANPVGAALAYSYPIVSLVTVGVMSGINALIGTAFFNWRRGRIDHNRQIDANIYRYSFDQDTYLLPQQRINSVIFVNSSDYQDRFEVRLWNASNGINDICFDVEIPEAISKKRYALA